MSSLGRLSVEGGRRWGAVGREGEQIEYSYFLCSFSCRSDVLILIGVAVE